LSVLATAVSGAKTAWGQVGPAVGEPEAPANTDKDDVEQKPLTEAEYQQARERRAREDAAQKQQEKQDEAESPPPLGDSKSEFEFGIRSGGGIPLGQATGDATADISSLMAAQFPIWGDVGIRFDEKIFFGLHASYGFGHLASEVTSACDQAGALGVSVTCRGSDTRIGLEVLYHAKASANVDLWFGGGLGWEWLSITQEASAEGQSQKVTVGASGMQLFMLQAGIDFEPIPSLGVGPFFAISNDMYFTVKTGCTGSCNGVDTGDAAIDNTSVHHWLFIGARASWRP
jgi:hypothetical protein